MKPSKIKFLTLVIMLLFLTLSACANETSPTDTNLPPSPAETTVSPSPLLTTEPTSTQPTANPFTEEGITVQETPVSFIERPEFRPEDRVREEELISLHGYSIGMTFAETQQIWKIPQNMIDYAIDRRTPEVPNLYIFVGNMTYDFQPKPDADVNNIDSYTLQQIYYGETVFCTNSEPLNVLRDIKLGDMMGDVLKSLPGNHTPQRWALDQLYGEYGKPNSASLEYTTSLGFYELRIYCESSWIRLSFGSSGKLWIAEVHSYGL